MVFRQAWRRTHVQVTGGSGPTEALCKTMTTRLKGSGMRWDPAAAQAMLGLAGLNDSNECEAYWRLQGVHTNESHRRQALRGTRASGRLDYG